MQSFKLPEALAWLEQQTGVPWTDSMLFDLCVGRGLALRAAPPLDARCVVYEAGPPNPPGVERAVMHLRWRHAVLYPLHVGQLWQVGETRPVPDWESDEPPGDSLPTPLRFAVFDPPVTVRREHLTIDRETLRKVREAWRNPSPVEERGRAEEASAPPAAPTQSIEPGTKWTDERVNAARTMRDRLKCEGVRDYAARTAAAFDIKPARLRQVLGPDARIDEPSSWPSSTHRTRRY